MEGSVLFLCWLQEAWVLSRSEATIILDVEDDYLRPLSNLSESVGPIYLSIHLIALESRHTSTWILKECSNISFDQVVWLSWSNIMSLGCHRDSTSLADCCKTMLLSLCLAIALRLNRSSTPYDQSIWLRPTFSFVCWFFLYQCSKDPFAIYSSAFLWFFSSSFSLSLSNPKWRWALIGCV